MSNTGVAIYKVFDKLLNACETIYDSEHSCEDCPMKMLCIRDVTAVDLAYDCPAETFKEMLDTADELSSYNPDKWQAEADYWDVRRNDPRL